MLIIYFRKIYWTEQTQESIFVSKSDGTMISVLFGKRALDQTSTLESTHPRAIVVSPNEGYV